MSFAAEEINYLIYRFLQESGLVHSVFTFGLESQVAQSKIKGSDIPYGALISIVQKGILYTQAEISIKEDGSEKLIDSLSLLDAVRVPIIVPVPKKTHVKKIKKTNKKGLSEDDLCPTLPLNKLDVSDNPEKNTIDEARKVGFQQRRSENVFDDASSKCIQGRGYSGSLEVMCHNSLAEKSLKSLKGHTADVYMCDWNPVEDMLASCSLDATARIWDMTDKSAVNTKQKILFHCGKDETKSNKEVTCLAWSSDGKYLATGSYDGIVRIWLNDGNSVFSFLRHMGPILKVKWNIKGNYVLSASSDSTVVIWDVETGKCVQQYKLHSGLVLDVDWKSDTVFASCSSDKLVYVCEVGKVLPVKSCKGHTAEINSVKWDSLGILLASCSDDASLKVWSMDQNSCVLDFKEHTKKVYIVDWSPKTSNQNSTSILASGSFDNTVRLWDAKKGTCLQTFKVHTGPVYSVVFSPDGKLLASGSNDKVLLVWSTQTGNLVHSYKGTCGIFHVCWSPSGDKICASAEDGSLFTLDIIEVFKIKYFFCLVYFYEVINVIILV